MQMDHRNFLLKVFFDFVIQRKVLTLEKVGVMCSVNGPMEVKIKDEKLDKATIQVIFKPLEGYGGMIHEMQ